MLVADPRVERVRTVARGPLAEHPRVVHTRADLRDAAARRALGGVDVLWHLGAQVWRGPDQASVNVDGTANVLDAAPRHVVLASSAAVYGAHADNPLPLTEDCAPRPNAECAYARQKLESERLASTAAPSAIMRIAAVLGPHADRRVARAARAYRAVVPTTGAPLALQFLHEDDAARALLSAGMGTACGVWNVAPDDWLDANAMARVTGGRVVRVPRRVMLVASEAAFRLGALPFGADRACLLSGPLALGTRRARDELGWSAARTSADALAAAVAQGSHRYIRHVR